MAERYGFSTAIKTARAESEAAKAKEGQLGQQVLNALLGMATAYVTGGAGAALGGQLIGGGAATAAGALAPSAANVLPAFESGISSLVGKGGETPNEAAQLGMAQGLSQSKGSIKEKFAEDLINKKWAALQVANKGLVPGKISMGAEGGVTRTLEQPKLPKLQGTRKNRAIGNLSSLGAAAYTAAQADINSGTEDIASATQKISASKKILSGEKAIIIKNLKGMIKGTTKGKREI